MSKYDPLRDHLHRHSGYVNLTLDQVSDLVPGGLPPSAYLYEIWWANDDSSHAHCRSWGDAGYRADVDLGRRTVRFVPK